MWLSQEGQVGQVRATGGIFYGGGDYFNNHSPHHRYVPHCRDPVYFRHSSHLV